MTRPPKEHEADFLSRWSRLKQDARHAPPAAEEPAEPPAPAGAADAPERTEAEILEELGLPDPETLGPGSDFKAFMAEAVPDVIRRKALRKLWTSNPALANLDMLVDYGEDYTDKARVVANLQSAYKAGRGYLDRLAEKAETQDASAGPDEVADAAASEEPRTQPPTPDPDPDPGADAAAPNPAADPGEETPPDEDHRTRATLAEMPPPRRRMRFEIDD